MTERHGKDALRVVFAGGTTGGHLMPGAATAQALQEQSPGCRCLFLTSGRKSERICGGAIDGFEKSSIPATPWAGLKQKMAFPVRSAVAAAQTAALYRRFRPQLVVGLGSYNSAVPLLVARAMGLRTAIFEGNAIAGKVVRWLAPLVDCVLLQWPEAAAELTARRIVARGNPVRRDLFLADRSEALRNLGLEEDKVTLLAMGGSQGALSLNRALQNALRRVRTPIQVIHLTGAAHLPEALKNELSLAPWYRAFGFMPMGDAYAAADLVLSRAGAATLAELTALGLPSILIPYPYAARRHQHSNAAILEKAGAAVVLDQTDLTARRLANAIQRLASGPALRRRMSKCALRLGRPAAAGQVAAHLAALAGFQSANKPFAQHAHDFQTHHLQAA
ncbi:MAG: undecaprenyldiphospho-muramoylpentapeptide beta-N-acetylglucosaminyltransferase [Planctomycetes bacterium]|nr:undecaprenyldiphospho-muramoylpentapeptide beta-N-acetylglucosaminyltransferase [Planctomycetota bacterium]